MLPGPVEATRSSLPRCIECGRRPCECAPIDDPSRTDPYAHGGSQDSHYVGAGDHDRLERRERCDRLVRELIDKGQYGPIRLGAPSDDTIEQAEESVYDHEGRRSLVYGVPAGDLPASAGVPHGFEWTPKERDRRDRAQHRGPPPLRDNACYGPRANNPEGWRRFRKDRAEWYEAITDQPLPDDEKHAWQLCDAIARRYRVDATRSGRPGAEGTGAPAVARGPRCIECGCNPCECPGSDEEVDWGPCDDY